MNDSNQAVASPADTNARDAARYRQLRRLLYRGPFDIAEAVVDMDVIGYCPSYDEFDAAIDAAISKESGHD